MQTIYDLAQGLSQRRPVVETVLTIDGAPATGFFTIPGGTIAEGHTLTVAGTARNVSGSTAFILNNGAGAVGPITVDGDFSLEVTASQDADGLEVIGFHAHCEFTALTITVA